MREMEDDGEETGSATEQALDEASRLLVEAFEALTEVMPPAVASVIACQVIEDLALAAGRGASAVN